ncbi:MAG: hypothetical protein WDO13_15360 [Verrucomicrobiota bacterium]
MATLASLSLAPAAPLMRDFMGVDGHLAFKPELYRPACQLVRNYHPTVWDLGDDTTQPPAFPFARNRVDWSAVYGAWKSAENSTRRSASQ